MGLGWKSYSQSITIPHGPKCYGKVRSLKGRVFYRNYPREIKNGIRFTEIIAERLGISQAAIRAKLDEVLV